MLPQSASKKRRRDPVEGAKEPPPVPAENGIGPGKDQKEMQVDHRHETAKSAKG